MGDQPGCPCSICEDDAAMSDNHQNTDIASPTMSVIGCHSQMTRQEMLTMTDTLRDRIAAAGVRR